jgi:hypothetical protein
MIKSATLLPVESFAQYCPAASAVTATLARLRFRLTFHMGKYDVTRDHCQTFPLPPQYHYEDASGTQVIYLAGQDHAEYGLPPLPPHASRWWVYPGRDSRASQRIQQELTRLYALSWQICEEETAERMIP